MATPALATGEIVCAGQGASVDLLVGHVPYLAIARAVVSVGDKNWSTDTALVPGTPIAVSQGFEDDRQLIIDLSDADMSEVLIRLRVSKLTEGEKYVAGGVLAIKGAGAFVVDCSEGG